MFKSMRPLTKKELHALKTFEGRYGIMFQNGGSCWTTEEGKRTFFVSFNGLGATFGDKLGKDIRGVLGLKREDELVVDGFGKQERF